MARNSFQFGDNQMDKYPPIPMVVTNTMATMETDIWQMMGILSVGDSFRSLPFSLDEHSSHPWLSQLTFELRIYPFGQFGHQNVIIVYLVLIDCPVSDHKLPELEVILTFNSHWITGRRIDVRGKKEFDWSKKQDRWYRLEIPSWKMSWKNLRLFSVRIQPTNFMIELSHRPTIDTQNGKQIINHQSNI